MQCKLLLFVWRIKCSQRLDMHSHIQQMPVPLVRDDKEGVWVCVWNTQRKMWLPTMGSTAPTFILHCTGGAGLEDVLLTLGTSLCYSLEFKGIICKKSTIQSMQYNLLHLKRSRKLMPHWINIYIHRDTSTHISEVFGKTIAMSYPLPL